MLYHATFRRNIEGIKKFGIKSMNEKNWEDAIDGLVCLATDPYNAESYCEVAADMSNDETLCEEDIIVFGIKEEDLNLKNYELIPDPNILFEKDEEIYSYVYTGIIPADKLYVITIENFQETITGKLNELTDIKKFN